MKRESLLTLILLFVLSVQVKADTYTSLWKQYAAAEQKDHPQTQLKVLQTIAAKAKAEHAYGHLLKAQMKTFSVKGSVSPDSLKPSLSRLESEARAAESTDVALASVYQAVIGKIYENHPDVSDSSEVLSKSYKEKSLTHTDALAKAYVTAYVPFAEEGVDSRIFGYDLLHVIGMFNNDYKTMHAYYSTHNNRAAACLCALQLLKDSRRSDVTRMKKSKYLQSLDSLIKTYQDLDVAGEVAIERYSFMEDAEDATAENKNDFINYALTHWGAWPRMNVLRNAQKRLTQPSFHVCLGESLLTPNTPRQVVIMSVCNIGELRLTVRKVNIGGDTNLNPNDTRDYEKLKKLLSPDVVASQTRRYLGLPDYKVSRDTMQIEGLPVGVYLVELSTSNANVNVERQLLRVSDLYPVVEALPDKKIRLAVLSATTGLPVPGAKVKITTNGLYGENDETITETADSKGEVLISYTNRKPNSFRVFTDTDNSFSTSGFFSNFSYYEGNDNKVTQSVELYTDRELYRPGQTVHVAGVAHSSSRAQGSCVVAGKTLKFILRDANYKTVETKEVVTDEFGTASADFTLPSSGLTGRFSIRCAEPNGFVSFSVEEYKRPTFQVEFEKVSTQYHNGDTLTVKGTAKSFAGVPVQGARVAYTITRRPSFHWCWNANRVETVELKRDTIQTDGDGTFTLQVPMILPESEDDNPRRYYAFDISADVTDVAGETRHGETMLPLSDYPTAFTCDIKEKMERDSVQTITFIYKNNAGEEIDGQVHYTVDGQPYNCKANLKEILPTSSWPSGKHELVAICGSDTLKTTFITFSVNDVKTVVKTHDWFYLSSNQFTSDGKPVYLQLGSSDSVQHIVYTLVAGKLVLENGTIDLKNGDLLTRPFVYKSEYGDGVRLSYAWVKEGKLYHHSATITRPQPDKRLLLKWTTFRDRLTPGQKETWQMSVTRPDGTVTKAQLMATLFDKSLDDIRTTSWTDFSLPQYIHVPYMQWTGRYVGETFMYGELSFRPLKERALKYYHFDTSIYEPLYAVDEVFIERHSQAVPMMKMAMATDVNAASGSMLGNAAVKEAAVEDSETAEAALATDAKTTDAERSTGLQKGGDAAQLRENFNETAMFQPMLTTDANGNVSIKFTLPESVTTWRFIGLAHDKDMNSGMIEGEAVAKKTVMVSPNLPRFLRTADKGQISSRLINTSEKQVSGTATLSLIDPATQKTVYNQSRKFTVKANETGSVAFDFDMKKLKHDGLLICRITASGSGYSDGEQHYLPILPDKELVTNTVPFTMTQAGTKEIDLSQLFAVRDAANKLTVEYTNNPAWLAIQSLPSVATVSDNNAVSLATAYYANSISKYMLKLTPDIKQTILQWKQEEGKETSMSASLQKNEELKSMLLSETPWVLDADREADQKQQLVNFFDESATQYRLTSTLSKLQKLQNPDGSFSWWPGMKGSTYLTGEVAEMLVRLNRMIGQQTNTRSLLDNAFKFMAKQIDKEVADLKKEEKKGATNLCPSSNAIGYLYLCAIDGRTLSSANQKNNEYLVNLLEKNGKTWSIQDKAQAAVIFAKNKRSEKATDLLESLTQYTVYKEDMGRYYDTPKSGYRWRDYRIPTQVSVIEVLKMLKPSDKQTIAEMQQWLLQSKRTQSWNTPINTVNAVYAFIDGETDKLSDGSQSQALLKVNGSKLQTSTATSGLGYVKATKTGDNLHTFTVSKSTEGTSWGAVYAQFMQPTTDVESNASGISVKREVLKDGKILLFDGTTSLQVGDKVTVRITVTADRDYDFVQVSDCRAACLEQAQQLSGYRNGFYCAPKDNVTNFYFDCLSKGKHVIETTYYVNRTGQYQSGTCTAQCAYSPEFMGRSAAVTLNVK